ncbi:MAG: ATP-binding protein [Clostridia bacterium]|nr:ATP-binding protein [Clostridia bacterium]
MKYSIEIGKIVEGAIKRDYTKVINYTQQLIDKLESDNEVRAASKFQKILSTHNAATLSSISGQSNFSIPVDSESRTLLADIIYPEENNATVVLSKNNTDEINEFVLSYKNADKLNAMGIEMSNTLILYGPPGCGKTQCAFLIAKELHLPLVIARLDSLISSYLGTTAKNIRSLFEFVQKMPCVLFLDEFDAIAKARDDSNELGELKRVVNSLLQNVDSMSKDSLLVAATNHESLLDPAVWRRFDYKLRITEPDYDAIIKMIDLFTHENSNLSQKDKEELAYVLLGLSGADIEEILIKAIRSSVILEKTVSKKDYYEEVFWFKGILNLNDSEKNQLKSKAKYLRNCNEKTFSLQVIADILDSSKTTISKLVKEDEE